MLSQSELEILTPLAKAYDAYEQSDWQDSNTPDAKDGKAIIDSCLSSPDKLPLILTSIQKGLIILDENASKACALLEKLSSDGFSDGSTYKQDLGKYIQKYFPDYFLEQFSQGDSLREILFNTPNEKMITGLRKKIESRSVGDKSQPVEQKIERKEESKPPEKKGKGRLGQNLHIDNLLILSQTYDLYEMAEWKLPVDGGSGELLLESCLTDIQLLKNILIQISRRLLDEKEKNNAEKCARLFDRLSKQGFPDGQFQQKFQENLRLILPDNVNLQAEGFPILQYLKDLAIMEREARQFEEIKAELLPLPKPEFYHPMLLQEIGYAAFQLILEDPPIFLKEKMARSPVLMQDFGKAFIDSLKLNAISDSMMKVILELAHSINISLSSEAMSSYEKNPGMRFFHESEKEASDSTEDAFLVENQKSIQKLVENIIQDFENLLSYSMMQKLTSVYLLLAKAINVLNIKNKLPLIDVGIFDNNIVNTHKFKIFMRTVTSYLQNYSIVMTDEKKAPNDEDKAIPTLDDFLEFVSLSTAEVFNIFRNYQSTPLDKIPTDDLQNILKIIRNRKSLVTIFYEGDEGVLSCQKMLEKIISQRIEGQAYPPAHLPRKKG
ncbi:MAG TPA: hypothetical protein VHM20_05870 [Gammaproteobacteria bacterium]|nr:hypothetical protein [Gammaproteobacteria bacterium]